MGIGNRKNQVSGIRHPGIRKYICHREEERNDDVAILNLLPFIVHLTNCMWVLEKKNRYLVLGNQEFFIHNSFVDTVLRLSNPHSPLISTIYKYPHHCVEGSTQTQI